MIIRAVHNKDNPYVMVKRSTAQHAKLPARALGLLVYLMSKPNDWEPTIPDICRRFPDIGKNQAYKIINEDLMRLGYARRVEERKNGRFLRWVIEIYEEPFPGFGEMENPENQTEPVPGFGDGGASSRLPVPENRGLQNKEVQSTDCMPEQSIEQQQAEDEELLAAAEPFDDPHESRHSFTEIEAFVIATKKHIKNPGGMARVLWRSGAEDKAIEQWSRQQQKLEEQKEQKSSARLADDFDWDGWIDLCIASGWKAQLESEYQQMLKRGGAKFEWELRIIAYLETSAAQNAAREQGDRYGDNDDHREKNASDYAHQAPAISG